MINYFRYAYPLPERRDAPFSVTTDMAVTPWNPETRLLRVGLRGYDLPRSQPSGSQPGVPRRRFGIDERSGQAAAGRRRR